ncbi:MAG: hypothetical protein HYY13_05520 [Nitrospirae bacterium]|nr:hypothetical protein [Nitrospirota bacterium]
MRHDLRRHRVVRALADTFITTFTGLFSLGGVFGGGFFFLGVPAACFAARFWDRLGRMWITRIVYALLLVSYVNDLFLLSALFYRGGSWWKVSLLCVVLGGLVVGALRWGGLTRLQGPLVSTGLGVLLLTAAVVGIPSKSKCEQAGRSPGIRALTWIRQGSTIPRFLIPTRDERLLFVGYRQSFFSGMVSPSAPIDLLDLESGEVRPALEGLGEVIGAGSDPDTGEVAMVVVRDPSRSPGLPEKEMIAFDPSGRVIRRVELPWGGAHDYSDAVAFHDGRLHILSAYPIQNELQVRRAEPDLRNFETPSEYFLCPIPTVVHHLQVGPWNYVSSGGPILTHYRSRAPDFCAVNLRTGEVLASPDERRYLFGGHNLAYDPVGGDIYAGGAFSNQIDVYDPNFTFKRSYRVGRIIRSLAVDGRRRVGYAPDYMDGQLRVFDLESGSVVGTTYVGRGSRVASVLPSGRLAVGSACGVFLVDVERVLSSAGKPEASEGSRPE